MDAQEQKLENLRKGIDYLYGFLGYSDEIFQTLKEAGIEELPNYNQVNAQKDKEISNLLMRILEVNETLGEDDVESVVRQLTDKKIKYTLDLNRMFMHLFSTSELKLQRKIVLPEKSGTYKFIIAPGKKNRELIKDFFYPETTSDLLFIADEERQHSEIASKHILKHTGESYEGLIYGGGRIDLNHEAKTIKIYGHSGSYGYNSDEFVEWLTKPLAAQGYTRDIQMNVGY